MKLPFQLPKMIAFFPVEPEQPGEKPEVRRFRGVAMIIAIMIISIMMMFATEFIVSSAVDLTLASSERDNVKAEFVAKSGANWAIWLNLFDYGLDLQFSSQNDPAMKAAKEGIGPLWDKLNDVFSFGSPLDLTKIDTFANAFGMNALLDSNAIAMFQSLGGELGVEVEDEGGKINLNVCYQSKSLCKIVRMQLDALLNCTEIERDYMKQHNIKTSEIVAKVQDWIDADQSAEPESGQSGEDDAYQKRVPPHRSKNSPLDTVDELKVIEGWTDDLHAYFSPYITVFPFVHSQDKDLTAYKLNVNSMNQDVLRCFFSRELSSPDAKEGFVKKFKDLIAKNGKVASSDKEIDSLLKDIIGYQGDPAEKGKETDKAGWLSTSSRAYRVKAIGVVGNQTRIVEFIMERQSVAQRKAVPLSSPWRLDGFTMK